MRVCRLIRSYTVIIQIAYAVYVNKVLLYLRTFCYNCFYDLTINVINKIYSADHLSFLHAVVNNKNKIFIINIVFLICIAF